MCMECAWFNTN